MKVVLQFKIVLCLILTTLFSGQSQTYTLNPNQLGTTCATCIANNNTNNPKGGGNNQVMNGNGTIANSYVATACGLNYVMGKVKLGKRLPQPGVNQPAAISITGLPACKQILKAFLYCGGSGNGIAVNATVQNPALTSSVFPMTMIGTHVDKCWGYAGTYNYRADITALITGNGNYNVSGIPTNPPTAGNDMDGASIVIVYSDPTQLYTGHIVIGDGCQVGIGGQQNNTITGWNACAASTFANAFMIVSDLQNVGVAACFMNSAISNFNYASASQDWWDNIVMSPAPNVTAGQTTAAFGLNSGGDCYNIVAEGLYYRTACNVCSVSGLTVTTAVTSSCTVGSATAFVTGGNAPYTYTWTPSALTTSAIANVPTGTYTVTVKDATGCFTGTALAVIPATNATIAVNSATICAGKSATLTAQGGNTYTWTPNATLSSGNGNPVVATPPSTQIYTVSTTNSLGCIGTTTTTVVVNPLPVVTPTATSPVCSGNPINLGVGASVTYTWAGPNAFASNLQSPTIAPSTTLNSGNYTVSVTNASGCTNSNVVNVLVNPTPTITAGNFGPYCAGATINLTVTASNTYTWTGPNAFSSNAQNPAIANSTTLNSGVYSVTVASAAGCTATASTTVVVNPKPTPTITSNSPLCQGSTLSLSVNPAVASYTWSGPNSFASNLQNPSVANVQTVSTGNYTVIVTTTAGCTGSTTANVLVNPTPTIAAGNTGPYCAGATINLTVSPSNTYTWSGPNAFTSNAQNPTIANSQTINTGSYSVTIATAAGCTNNAVTNVVVNALPTPTATSNSPVCSGKPINFTGLGGVTYTWTGPSGFTSNAQNPSIATSSVANNGNYTLTVTNANGCTNSVVLSVVVNTLPIVSVNSPTSCVGSSFTLTATGGTAYAWSGPNAYSSTLQNPPFPTASTSLTGNYTVIVTNAQSCTSTAVSNVVVVNLPTVTVSGNNVLCSQNFNNSINTTTLTASGANNYTWTIPTGFSGSPNLNTTPLVITPSITSVQTVATVSVFGMAGTCTSSAVYNLTINPNPTITVSSGSMCAGTSVNLNANGASTYTWSPATALNTTNGPSVIANPTVTTVYSVIGSSLGCNSQTQNGTATVVANPTVVINPNPAVICFGNNINLTASGASTYTWSPNIALTSTNTANTTANPTVTTTYSVLGSQATCTHVAAITVTVLGLPVVTITPSSPTLCMNNFNGSPNTVTLNATGAASYTWGPITGLTTNTLNGSSVVGTSNGAAIATGTVIGANGTCTNMATFTVNALPNPTITVLSATFCAGTSATLNASGATSYTWSPTASLNTAFGPQVIANPSVTTIYSVIGSSVGCNSQTKFGTAAVVANPTVSIAPLTPTICIGSSINLSANGATNYTWSPNTAITSTTGANVTVNPTVTTTYSIIGEAATCTHSAVRTVTVVNLPVITINLNTGNICMNNFNGSNNSVNITASGATSYNWLGFSGLSPNTLSSANVIATALPPSMVGSGTVIGTASTCTNIATFSIAIIPNPIISVPSASMCFGKSATLTASGATSYTWSPASSLSSPIGSQVIASPAQTSVYSIVGTSLNCNSATQTTTVDVVANPVISISPVNPTICAGSAIGLSAFGASTYTWSPANSLDVSMGANVIASPTVTTNYLVVGTLNTCTSTAIRQVSVIPLPNLQAVCQPSGICQGEQTQINANGASSYTWIPSIGLSNANSNFVIANPTITTVYSLIGNNGVCTATLSVPISVIPRPVLNLTTNNPRICLGQSATIFASGAQAYNWSPVTTSNMLNSSTALVTPSVTTNYTVTGYNYAGTVACAFTKEIEIEIVPQVTATIGGSVAICEGESVKLQAGGSNTYIWAPSTGLNNSLTATPYANPKSTTIYTVQVSNGGYCGATGTVLVRVNPNPTVNAGPDQILNSDEPMYINAVGTGSLTWIFGEEILCHSCPTSQVMPKNSGVYRIQAVNQFGCKAIDETAIEVTNYYNIYIPNIFTPNFDGLNDVFLVYGTGITELQMDIFDRWGEKLYTSTDQLKGWSGYYNDVLCKNDVYVYLITYKTIDGKKHTKTGHVTLLK